MKSTDKHVFEVALILSVLLALALLPLQAWSQPPADRGPISFNTFDADGDGEISEDEFNKARGERMAARSQEGRPMTGLQNMPSFADIDSDGSGTISEEEMLAHQQTHQAMTAGQGKAQGMGQGKGMGKAQGMAQGRGMGGMQMPNFEDIDSDGNGCISPEELAAHQQERHPNAQ